jgi:tRNA (adenine37-N6)-methyltransferase
MAPGNHSQRDQTSYSVIPVGVVHSPIKKITDDCWGGVISIIEFDSSRFSPDCTAGLAEFSHVEVIFLLDRISPEKVLMGAKHPRERADWPLVGIFAQRTKNRPNRIGITTCRLESVDGYTIRVRELDAIDGTPVLDVKPYLPGFAPKGEVREPSWSKELMAGYFRATK